MILLRSFLSGHIRIKRTLEYYDAGIGPRVPFGGGFGPTVSANFAVDLGDFDSLSSTSTMPPGGSISRAGNAMLYDSTGKLTYAPNNLILQSNDMTVANWTGYSSALVTTANSATAPDGTTTANTITLSANTRVQNFSVASGLAYIASVWLRTDSGTKNITIGDINEAGATTTVTVTTTWQRFSIKITKTNSVAYIGISQTTGTSPSTSGTVYAWGWQFEAVTYQTSPSGTYYLNYPTPNTTSAYYGPRFDYDPVTLQPKGLLVEGTRTNVAYPYTPLSGTSGWDVLGLTIAANDSTAPDGTNTAAKITEAAVTNNHYTTTTATANTSATTTYSAYFKAGTATVVQLLISGAISTNVWANFNLSSGVLGSVGTSATASIQSVGNGWYRCALSTTVGASTGVQPIFVSFTNNNASASRAPSYAGSTSTFLYMWGAQVESGAFPTSIIPTNSSSIARAAETFSLTGYSNRLVEAYYIDEQTGANFSGNSALSTGTVTISPPTFGWVTSLRAYQNAYAGSISSPSWLSFSRAGGAMYYDSTGTLTWAPVNELPSSNGFTNTTYWLAGGAFAPTISSSTVPSPDDTTNATKAVYPSISGAGNVGVLYTASGYRGNQTEGRSYLFSVYLRGDVGGETLWIMGTPNGSTFVRQAVTLTTSWQRFVLPFTATALQNFLQIGVDLRDGSQSAKSAYTIYVYGAQLEPVTYQTAPSAYIPTTSAAVYGPRYDYDPRTYFGFTATITNATPNSTFVVPATFGDGSAASATDSYYVGQTALINGVSYPVTAYVASTRTATILGLPASGSQSILLGNPEWQKPRGLLIEEQMVNLCTYSQDLRNTAAAGSTRPWVLAGAKDWGSGSVADAITAPDGTTTADFLCEDTSTATHRIDISLTTTAVSHTMTIYAKAGGRTRFEITAIVDQYGIGFDLTNGSVIAGVYASNQGTGAMSYVGNGWYRCSMTWPATAASQSFRFPMRSGATVTYTGDGVSGVYLWGAQLEAGFVTSYIPTVASSVARAADVAQLTGSALTTLQGTQMTLAAEAVSSVATNRYLINARKISGSNYGDYYSLGSLASSLNVATVNQATLTYSPAPTTTSIFRAAFAIQANNFAAVANNGTVQTDGTGSIVTGIDQGWLGGYSDGVYLNGYVRSMALYNQRLPDAILKQKSQVNAPY